MMTSHTTGEPMTGQTKSETTFHREVTAQTLRLPRNPDRDATKLKARGANVPQMSERTPAGIKGTTIGTCDYSIVYRSVQIAGRGSFRHKSTKSSILAVPTHIT